MTAKRATKALIILDGYGVETSESSAIQAASTPVWDKLLAENPNSRIQTSGMAVGLPEEADGELGSGAHEYRCGAYCLSELYPHLQSD